MNKTIHYPATNKRLLLKYTLDESNIYWHTLCNQFVHYGSKTDQIKHTDIEDELFPSIVNCELCVLINFSNKSDEYGSE